MSIRNTVAAKIEELRRKIAVWDDPKASNEAKGTILAELVGNDPEIWKQIAKVASRKLVTKPAAAAITTTTATIATAPPAPKPVAQTAAPAPATKPASVVVKSAMPVPQTAGPARKLHVAPPTPVGASDFAIKLNGVAKDVGLEDHSVIGRFRSILAENGKGSEYWDLCREVVEDALKGAEFTESDWNLLVEKMKLNLFFTGKKGSLFIERCPKEKLEDLLIGQDGLVGLIAQIKTEEEFSPSAIYRIAFVFDACLKVGHEAKALRVNCAHAVNRLRQKGWLPGDHWLAKKIADAKTARSIPPEKFASPDEVSKAS